MALVGLLLLFAFPLPLLVPPDGPDLLLWLITCCLAGIVGLITALLVKSPGKKQAARANESLSVVAAPKVLALVLLILLLASKLMHLGLPLLIALLLSLMAICLIPALIVKIRNSNQQAERATEPLRPSLSPRVWIIVSPVLFLLFCMEFEFIGIPDYPDFSAALIVWFLTGLASLIILLALKLGSRVSTYLPNQELLQQTYEQG